MARGVDTAVLSTDAFLERFDVSPIGSGALDGTTFAVKDLIDVAHHVTGCGNPRWRETHPPAAVNACVIDLLLTSGATLVGKTITDEFAFSIIGENAHYGTPLNPRAPDRVPGGSSSGSASAVARGECDFAIGTDTAGSVRVPAANCGLFGMRPSHGRTSLAGVMPFSPSFDTVGVFARDLFRLESAMCVLLGEDPAPLPRSSNPPLLLRDAWNLCQPEIAAACRQFLSDSGIRATEIGLAALVGDEGSDPGLWLGTHCQIQWAEIAANLRTWIAAEKPELGPLIAANFGLLEAIDRPRLPERIRMRERLAAHLAASLAGGRILCFPTTSATAPRKGQVFGDRREDSYMAPTLMLQTFATIGRLPQVTIPIGEIERAPVGLSFLAAAGSDGYLLGWLRKTLSPAFGGASSVSPRIGG